MTTPTNTTFTIGGDLVVRRLGFGAMRVTGDGIWGEPRDREGAKILLRRVIELGINLIDTADSYGPDVSERLIREALHPYPSDLVIATKGGLTRGGPGDWRRKADPAHLREACEGSLTRLGVERIDLYQLHAPDPRIPLEDSLGALAELRSQGKIRHVGLSNVTVDELRRARTVVDVVSVQNHYNLNERMHEPVLAECEREGLGFLPYFPVALGKLDRQTGAIGDVARDHGATPCQVGLAWLLAHSPVMMPIPGTSSIAHLEENTTAADLRLSDEELTRLGH